MDGSTQIRIVDAIYDELEENRKGEEQEKWNKLSLFGKLSARLFGLKKYQRFLASERAYFDDVDIGDLAETDVLIRKFRTSIRHNSQDTRYHRTIEISSYHEKIHDKYALGYHELHCIPSVESTLRWFNDGCPSEIFEKIQVLKETCTKNLEIVKKAYQTISTIRIINVLDIPEINRLAYQEFKRSLWQHLKTDEPTEEVSSVEISELMSAVPKNIEEVSQTNISWKYLASLLPAIRTIINNFDKCEIVRNEPSCEFSNSNACPTASEVFEKFVNYLLCCLFGRDFKPETNIVSITPGFLKWASLRKRPEEEYEDGINPYLHIYLFIEPAIIETGEFLKNHIIETLKAQDALNICKNMEHLKKMKLLASDVDHLLKYPYVLDKIDYGTYYDGQTRDATQQELKSLENITTFLNMACNFLMYLDATVSEIQARCNDQNQPSYFKSFYGLRGDEKTESGSFGKVYKRKCLRSNVDPIAIKVIPVEQDITIELFFKMLEEKEVPDRYINLNMLRFSYYWYQLNYEKDCLRTRPIQLYFAMEYCDETLAKYLEDRTEFRKYETVGIIRTLIEVLCVLQPNIHRDLKPENIFIKRDKYGFPHFVVGDFGQVCQKRCPIGKTNSDHTPPAIASGSKSKSVGYGTPDYSAPELLRNDLYYSSKVDIYSVGKIIEKLFAFKNDSTKIELEDFPEMLNLTRLMISEDPDSRPTPGECHEKLEKIEDRIYK